MIKRTTNVSAPDTIHIQDTLIVWYKSNRRQFSWRTKIRRPYEVLICEIMAQQTQASRIEQFLTKFLERFPTVETLASASRSDVVRQWQGLGYNRRALNLHEAAKQLANKPFPKSQIELLKLPGVGQYTVNAILIFAFNKPIVTIDVNIERLLSRISKKMPDTNTMLSKEEVFSIAQSLLPPRGSRLWHEALMDFGATICTKRNPHCDTCPLLAICKSGRAFLRQSNPPSDSTKSREQKYFGHPRRIWRGRVLKIISSHEGITTSSIVKELLTTENRLEFGPFIKSVATDLAKDGFCELRKNKYYLA